MEPKKMDAKKSPEQCGNHDEEDDPMKGEIVEKPPAQRLPDEDACMLDENNDTNFAFFSRSHIKH